MKSIMVKILLTVLCYAVAWSIPITGRQQPAGGNRGLSQRDVDSTSQTDNANAMVDNFMAEIANLSMPGYLKDLFINLTHSNEIDDLSDSAKVNTIRSYENQAKNVGCGHYKFHIKKHELDEEDVIRAELHLLQKSPVTLGGHYNVEIYYLLNKKVLELPSKLSFTHIDSTPGWKTFDVTPIVLKWKQGLANHGLQVKLTQDGNMVSCEGVFTEEEHSMEKPSLVVFTHDHSTEFPKEHEHDKASQAAIRQKRRRRHSDIKVTTNTSAKEIQNVGCHLAQMMVQAESLIIGSMHALLPKQFNAGKCEGHCTKLDSQNLQRNGITSHADILYVHYQNTVGIEKAPSRCCKATSFKKVPMVFYDSTAKEKFIKVNIPGQVTECSCL